jgi:hypothetical protein
MALASLRQLFFRTFAGWTTASKPRRTLSLSLQNRGFALNMTAPKFRITHTRSAACHVKHPIQRLPKLLRPPNWVGRNDRLLGAEEAAEAAEAENCRGGRQSAQNIPVASFVVVHVVDSHRIGDEQRGPRVECFAGCTIISALHFNTAWHTSGMEQTIENLDSTLEAFNDETLRRLITQVQRQRNHFGSRTLAQSVSSF